MTFNYILIFGSFGAPRMGVKGAAVATVVSAVRRAWYRDYGSALEVLAQCVLDGQSGEESE